MDELPDTLKPLAKLLDKNEPRVLVFVGTGVSMGATSIAHSSWLGLLEYGIDYLVESGKFTSDYRGELKADLKAAFSPFDLDKALDHAENVQRTLSILRPQEFSDWLHNSFSGFKAQAGRTDTLDAIRDLQQAGALIVTTNYDSLLSDVTGLPPVTWEEHAEFLSAINNRDRILHIHGHWKRPSSIILGKSSYDRIVADDVFQSAFRGLWMYWSWMYVGCGDGLDDPNLGSLLRWGKGWGDGALPHYFLARTDKAIEVERRPDRSENLISVPFEEFSDLPKLLRSVTPAVRCSPFVLVDEGFRWFRDPNASPLNPFPSRREFLDGKVPKLSTDDEVIARLKTHNWAFVLDVASVGKTTLALRMATLPEQQNHPVFYLDLANVDIEDAGEETISALKRLSRQNTLLVVDNAHHQPELARKLWDQWRDNPCGSKLLVIATKAQRHTKVSPAHDLVFFEKHAENPAVELRPTEGDLENILNHIYLRVAESYQSKPKRSPSSRLSPPADVLKTWHKDFGSALGAFCLAILGRLQYFEQGKWELSTTAASDWVKEKWLKDLDAEYIENLLCLSVFGAQELELNVVEEALPYPEKTSKLMNSGLVVRTDLGKFGQYRQYALREPDWGRLILATQTPPVNEDPILFMCASRDAGMANLLSWRLRSMKTKTRFQNLWLFLSQHPDRILQVYSYPLAAFLNLAKGAGNAQQEQFVTQFWDAIEADPQQLAEIMWGTSLDHVGAFFEAAEKQGRNTGKLWKALESDKQRLINCLKHTLLDKAGSFLNVAQRHGRNVDELWDALESELWDALESDPHESELWDALVKEPQKFAERAWATPLEQIGTFIETAKKHGRDVSKLWETLESEPQKLAERVWGTPLDHVGSFMKIAKRHKRDVNKLWNTIESEPQKLAERLMTTSLEHFGSFIETAKDHGRDVGPLWETIETAPQKIIERAWATPLVHVGTFIEIAKRHERDIRWLCDALETDPPRLAQKAKISQVDYLSAFCKRAPDSTVRVLLEGIQPDQWNSALESGPFHGSMGLASRCEDVGRNDLKAALVSIALRRANWKDFPLGSVHSVVWLLSNVSEEDSALIPVFIDKICTKRWLGWQYSSSACRQLAAGLRLLAVSQNNETRQRFYNIGLRARLETEFNRFSSLPSGEQYEVVQLLGCAALLGWNMKVGVLNHIPIDQVCALHAEVLPHRPDAEKVGGGQINFWLGLRTLGSMTNKPLPMPVPIIEQTLGLWKKNLDESLVDPHSMEHTINSKMVSWLEDCLRKKKGLLPTSLVKVNP